MRLLFLLILSVHLFGCSTVGTRKIIVTDDGVVKITNVKLMSEKDRTAVKRALYLIEKIDPNQTYPFIPAHLYWANLGERYAGITVTYGINTKNRYKHVYIDRETMLLNSNDPNRWVYFGALLSHELNHYFYDTDDPFTGKITNELIYKKLKDKQVSENLEKWFNESIKSH